MSSKYNSLEEIKADLKKYKLEQQIALEELKLVKNNFTDEVKHNLVPSTSQITNVLLKYSTIIKFYKIIRRIF